MSAAPSLKETHLKKAWDCIKQGSKPDDAQGLPAKTWSAMPLRTRAVLVMLGAQSMEDPREVARRPWPALSDSDRVGIAACARSIGKDLRDAACLF